MRYSMQERNYYNFIHSTSSYTYYCSLKSPLRIWIFKHEFNIALWVWRCVPLLCLYTNSVLKNTPTAALVTWVCLISFSHFSSSSQHLSSLFSPSGTLTCWLPIWTLFLPWSPKRLLSTTPSYMPLHIRNTGTMHTQVLSFINSSLN